LDQPATIVKLGGSVVTRKDRPLTTDLNSIQGLCEELARSGTGRLIVIHGGGSYGHYLVHRLRLLPPSKSADRISLARVVQGMDVLSSEIVKALIGSGLPGVVLPSFAVATSRLGRIRSIYLNSLRSALKIGLVPVMRGDLCCDEATGYDIISGDTVAGSLAKRLRVGSIIMCLDRDGLEANGRPLPVVRMRDRSYRDLIWRGPAVDVTGGMAHKLEVLRPLARRGVRLLLINGRRRGRLLDALKGRDVIGTELKW
jgi:isopentenyl phosphate kinase